MAKPTEIKNLKNRLLDGIKVLTGEGVLTGSGHLSARIPGTDSFLINLRYAGILADFKDICTVDLSGKRIAGSEPIPLETTIHSTIYRNRPDVTSVLHCHARHAIMVSLLDGGLIPFHREARAFEGGVPIFPNSNGIHTDALAQRMADCLGQHSVVLLRGHGIVVTARSIEGTCVSAIQLERACSDQLLLASSTTIKPMTEEYATQVKGKDENPYRAWPFLLYKHKVRARKAIKSTTKTMIKALWPKDA